MKATLEFNLPEDADAHRIAVRSWATHEALRDLDTNLRSWIKHGHGFQGVDEVLAYVRRELAPLLED